MASWELVSLTRHNITAIDKCPFFEHHTTLASVKEGMVFAKAVGNRRLSKASEAVAGDRVSCPATQQR